MNRDNNGTEVEHLKRQNYSENVSPVSPKYNGHMNPNIQGLQVKSYSFYGDEEHLKVNSGRDINSQRKSDFVQPIEKAEKEKTSKNQTIRSNAGMLSQSTHHSPAKKYETVPSGDQRATQAQGKQYSVKNNTVKDEISRFSYKRLVNHLEKKYQDIRSIFKSDANERRAQARLASPSPTPTPEA